MKLFLPFLTLVASAPISTVNPATVLAGAAILSSSHAFVPDVPRTRISPTRLPNEQKDWLGLDESFIGKHPPRETLGEKLAAIVDDLKFYDVKGPSSFLPGEKTVVESAMVDLVKILADRSIQDTCRVIRKGASDSLNVVKGAVAAVCVIGKEVIDGICLPVIDAVQECINWVEEEKRLK